MRDETDVKDIPAEAESMALRLLQMKARVFDLNVIIHNATAESQQLARKIAELEKEEAPNFPLNGNAT